MSVAQALFVAPSSQELNRNLEDPNRHLTNMVMDSRKHFSVNMQIKSSKAFENNQHKALWDIIGQVNEIATSKRRE